MKVSILIVSWNVRRHLVDCIDSINAHPAKTSFEVIVIDNNSADDTVEYLNKHYPEVKVIVSPDNLGFGRANNQAAKQAEGKYFFILNPDTSFLEGTLDGLVEFMDNNPDIAICGPKVINEDGSTQRSVRNFQSWKAAFYKHTPLKYLGLFKADFNHYRCRGFDYSLQADVEQLIGAALLIRREVFEQFKGFDELFFMYYEEVDLCYRIKQGEQRIVYYPGAKLVHLGGKSSAQVSAGKQFMILQSLVRFLNKHSEPSQALLLVPLLKAGVLLLMLCEVIVSLVGFVLLGVVLGKKKRNKYKRNFKEAYSFLAEYSWKFLQS